MATKYVCDRCKLQFDFVQDIIEVTLPHHPGVCGFDHSGYDMFKRDLCTICVKSLHDWLNKK